MQTYNCSDSTSSAYGAGNYGTCTGQSVGAPNTGVFGQLVDSGSFSIIVPFAVVILLSLVVTVVVGIRKKQSSRKNG